MGKSETCIKEKNRVNKIWQELQIGTIHRWYSDQLTLLFPFAAVSPAGVVICTPGTQKTLDGVRRLGFRKSGRLVAAAACFTFFHLDFVGFMCCFYFKILFLCLLLQISLRLFTPGQKKINTVVQVFLLPSSLLLFVLSLVTPLARGIKNWFKRLPRVYRNLATLRWPCLCVTLSLRLLSGYSLVRTPTPITVANRL